MPPKSSNKKNNASATPSWYHCDKCKVHITIKEREKHEQKCPIQEKQTETDKGEYFEYIRKGTLYTGSYEKRKFDVEELKEMPPKYINNLIFISEGAIRLAGWHIGQQVVITIDSTFTLIRSIWPIPEMFLTTVYVSEEGKLSVIPLENIQIFFLIFLDYNNYWSSLRGRCLRICAVPVGQPKVAKTLLMQIQTSNQDDEPLTSQQLKDVDRLLKLELRNLSFTLDSVVYFNFFNKPLILKIIYWSAINNEDPSTVLQQSLNNLNINKHSAGDYIFKVTNFTTIEVSSENIPNSDDETENITKYLITRKDIGGLNSQLEIIEEAIDFALGLRKIPQGKHLFNT